MSVITNSLNNRAYIFDVDNINLDANTISTTNTNGNLTLTPNGTGKVAVNYATPNAVTIYGAAGALVEVGPLTNGQLLIGSTGAAPQAATLASSGSTIVFSTGAGTLNLETSADTPTSIATDSGTVTPAAHSFSIVGGTGIDTSGATSVVTITFDVTEVPTIPTSVTTSSGTATPAGNAFSIVGAGNISTSATGSTVTITGSSGPSWTVVTAASANLVASQGIFANRASGVTLTLPTTAAVGDTFEVVAMHADGFTILENALQSIRVGANITTVATGSITSTGIGDWIEIVCNVANTGFFANVKQGNLTVA